MKKNIFFTLIIIISFACCKTGEIEPPVTITPLIKEDTTNITSPRLIWKCRIHLDSAVGGGTSKDRMYVYKDKVIFADNYTNNNIDSTAVRAIDVNKAKLVWNYKNFRLDYVTGSYIFENKGAFTTGSDVEVIDLNSGKNIWGSSNKGVGHYRINGDKNNLYYIWNTKGSAPYDTECKLVKAPIDGKQWQEIYTNYEENKIGAGLELPAFYDNEKGEKILFFQNRALIKGTTKGYVRLFAYNETQKKMEWKSDSLDYNSNVDPPLIYKEKLYFNGDNQVICLELKTGKVLWRKVLRPMVLSDLIIEDNKLFVKSDDKSMFCIDPNTGNEIWSNYENNSQVAFTPIYHKGTIYYCSWSKARLEAVDAATGKVLWQYKSPFSKGQMALAIGIDHDRNLLYGYDGFHVYCFQIPK